MGFSIDGRATLQSLHLSLSLCQRFRLPLGDIASLSLTLPVNEIIPSLSRNAYSPVIRWQVVCLWQANLAAIFHLGAIIIQGLIVLNYPMVDYLEECENTYPIFHSGSPKMFMLRCDYVSYRRTPLVQSFLLLLNQTFHLYLGFYHIVFLY